MCCLVAILLLVGPRATIVVWYLLEPARWQRVFDNLIVPLVGFIFLPWTTLAYVLAAPGGIDGLDWLWLAIAVAVDFASYGGGAWGNRRRPRSW